MVLLIIFLKTSGAGKIKKKIRSTVRGEFTVHYLQDRDRSAKTPPMLPIVAGISIDVGQPSRSSHGARDL